jgi:TctA family transporter
MRKSMSTAVVLMVAAAAVFLVLLMAWVSYNNEKKKEPATKDEAVTQSQTAAKKTSFISSSPYGIIGIVGGVMCVTGACLAALMLILRRIPASTDDDPHFAAYNIRYPNNQVPLISPIVQTTLYEEAHSTNP